MRHPEHCSLVGLTVAAGVPPHRFLADAEGRVSVADLSHCTSFEAPIERFRGHTVFITSARQLPAALALLQLDGIARRVVLKAVRAAIRAAGAKLFYLPAYSPDPNPIEKAFSKLKTLLRKQNARTIERVENCIAELLRQISPDECLNFFREAGYAST
jgi:transposase